MARPFPLVKTVQNQGMAWIRPQGIKVRKFCPLAVKYNGMNALISIKAMLTPFNPIWMLQEPRRALKRNNVKQNTIFWINILCSVCHDTENKVQKNANKANKAFGAENGEENRTESGGAEQHKGVFQPESRSYPCSNVGICVVKELWTHLPVVQIQLVLLRLWLIIF